MLNSPAQAPSSPPDGAFCLADELDRLLCVASALKAREGLGLLIRCRFSLQARAGTNSDAALPAYCRSLRRQT